MACNRNRKPGRQSRSLVAALAMTSLCTAPAFAQLAGKGGINGRVTDTSGAVIPDADVQVLQAGTNLKQEAHTTGAGDYSFSVDPGKYTVVVTHNGFRSVRQENVPIDALQVVEVNVTLQTGQVNEEITVTDTPRCWKPAMPPLAPPSSRSNTLPFR